MNVPLLGARLSYAVFGGLQIAVERVRMSQLLEPGLLTSTRWSEDVLKTYSEEATDASKIDG
jgi:hypothetical protein